MSRPVLGLIHPGQMGSTLGAAAASAGARVLWASAKRSARTAARAADAGLEDVGELGNLVSRSDVIFSVCPPHAAVSVAETVSGMRFGGVFVDANAVSPDTARRIAAIVESAGATFVDGGIIGPPVKSAGTTRIYFSGRGGQDAVTLFDGSLLEAHLIAGESGAASALKMAYAAWTKGSAALLISVRALARAENIEQPLLNEWAMSQAGLETRSDQAARGNAFKAWRFVAEMHEIADTFAGAGLPDGFHRAAADIYERLKTFRECNPPPELARILEQALKSGAR